MSENSETTEVEVVEQAAEKPAPAKRAGYKTRDDMEAELMETIHKNHGLRDRVRELGPKAERADELEGENAKLKAHYRKELAFAKLEAMAVREGIVDSDALRLIGEDQLVFSEEGKPTNLAEVLSEFKSAKPHFFTEAAAPNQSTASHHTAPPTRSPAVNVKELSSKDFTDAWNKL